MSMLNSAATQPVEVLLVEDDPGDVFLTKKALRNGSVPNRLTVVNDGREAMELLERRGRFREAKRPDLILMDLNMPRMDGRATLAAIKSNQELRLIPIVILTTSDSDKDVVDTYDLHANCYVTKPVDLKQFTAVVRLIKDFWFMVVRYPSRESA